MTTKLNETNSNLINNFHCLVIINLKWKKNDPANSSRKSGGHLDSVFVSWWSPLNVSVNVWN
jgi:hypothetical protein